MSLRFLFLVLAIGLFLTSAARADLIAADSFNDKTVGALNGQGGGTGAWTGNYASLSGVTVVAGGLNYSAGQVNIAGGSQALRITGPAAATDQMFTRGFATQTGPLYFSLLFRPGLTPDTSTTDGDFVQFLLNDDMDEANAGSIGMGRTDTNNPFFSRIGLSGGGGDTDLSGVLAQDATTYFLVGRFTQSGVNGIEYDTMSLWVNPNSLTETSPLVTSFFDSNSASLSFLTLRTAGLVSDFYLVDEFRLGTSFDAVVVPEPSTWLSCGLLLAGGWIVRRRSKTAAVRGSVA